MKIISVANQKGGCGKTTTAINLVSSLADNKKRVLLLDLDPQAHATLGLNRDDQYSIYNVISRITPRKMNIKDIIQRVERRFDLIPSNVLLGTLEQELADEIGRETKLLDALKAIEDQYDYIIIDCPPSLGFLTVNALRASSQVIIPAETSRFSVQGVEHLMDIVHLIRERLNHPLEAKVLVTMFDSRLRHSFSVLDTMKSKFKDILFSTIIHVNVKLKESAVEGKTVLKYDKYSRGSKDYFSLAREMITIDEGGVFAQAVVETKQEQQETLRGEFSDKMKDLVAKETQKMICGVFSLNAPHAQSVYVAGSFNDWSISDAFRMKKDEQGRWSIRLPLNKGIYQYQFVVDGRWQSDPENECREPNGFGDMNSVVEVGINA